MSSPAYTHGTGPFDDGFLQVSNLHRIYYSQYGKPDGKPVVFLHGGPGGNGTTKANAGFFNPAIYRAVLFDQRGAGSSEPPHETRENTTQLLIQDIETLRNHLGIKKWHMVFGGSWGSTLSLAYAQAHPESCGSLVLRGVFLGSREEVDLVNQFTGMVFPEPFDRFINYLPEAKRGDPLKGYHELINSSDPKVANEAAKEWNRWELSIVFLEHDASVFAMLEDERWNMNHAKLETHYFTNGCFLEPNQLLKGCDKIKHIPTSIVQGRYDLVCPARGAYDVNNALPQSRLYWIANAGHSATETGTRQKLIEVCDEYAQHDFHMQ